MLGNDRNNLKTDVGKKACKVNAESKERENVSCNNGKNVILRIEETVINRNGGCYKKCFDLQLIPIKDKW